MVSMRNITVKENGIYMDCYKEGDSSKHFSMLLDSATFDILECSLEEPSIYARQAALKIAELSTKGELPDNATSIWC